jgi:hypothetical protein
MALAIASDNIDVLKHIKLFSKAYSGVGVVARGSEG